MVSARSRIGADAREVQRLVCQHRADVGAARLVRTHLHAFEKRRRITLEEASPQSAVELQPDLVQRSQDFNR